MNKKILGHSLVTAFWLGSTVASAEPSSVSGITILETQLRKLEQEGRCDPRLLSQLADLYYSAGQNSKGRETFKQVLAIYEHGKAPLAPRMIPYTLSHWGDVEYQYAHDFAVAERLKLRALALWDKLPANSSDRIRAHQAIIGFYRASGRGREANLQTQQLAKLMGTTDPKNLFPPHNCPACGKG